MPLKLFKVDVENFVYVLAQDKEKAERFVEACSGGISAGDIMEGAWCSASEVNSINDVDGEWLNSIPFVSYRENKDDAEILEDLTCEKIIEMTKDQQEKIRTAKLIDKSQLTLPLDESFTKKPDPIVCKACGYTGNIETYAPSMGIYSDIRCPKCGSTSNDHNSNYLKELNDAMKNDLDKPSE